jgi:ubiquinone/menaquinone biosynthesis C-methylase UbiE
MKDSLHHISEYSRCLEEIHRVLKPNGKLSLCEPSWTPFARFIFGFFHPEVYKVKGIDFHRFQQTENQALMYFLHIHRRSDKNFLYRYFSLTVNKNINALSYLLSGGATFNSLINSKNLLNFSNWEIDKDLWMQIFSLNRIQVFIKKF